MKKKSPRKRDESDRKTEKQGDSEIERQRDRETGIWTDSKRDRQTDGQIK